MKRVLIVLLTVVGLSSASAQSDLFVGGSLELEFVGSTLVSLDGHVGDYGLFSSFGGRATLGLGLSPDVYLKLAADTLFPFQTSNPELTPYVGGGFGIYIDEGTLFNIRSVGGVDFQVAEELSLFAEVAPGIYINDGDSDFGAGLRFGINYSLN